MSFTEVMFSQDYIDPSHWSFLSSGLGRCFAKDTFQQLNNYYYDPVSSSYMMPSSPESPYNSSVPPSPPSPFVGVKDELPCQLMSYSTESSGNTSPALDVADNKDWSIKSSSVPEFSAALARDAVSQRSSIVWQVPESLFRNYYHTMNFRVPPAVYEGCRIYIDSQLGYSGNAKRFKHAPEVGEKALILEGTITDQLLRPITQCAACAEYFDTKSYFAANPQCKGRILLIKNNQVTKVKNDTFSLQLKPMCCSRHFDSLFYVHLALRDSITNEVVVKTDFTTHVKQWKKTSSTPTSGAPPAKRQRVSKKTPSKEAHPEDSTVIVPANTSGPGCKGLNGNHL